MPNKFWWCEKAVARYLKYIAGDPGMRVRHKYTECGINEGNQNEREHKALTQQTFLEADFKEIPTKHVCPSQHGNPPKGNLTFTYSWVFSPIALPFYTLL